MDVLGCPLPEDRLYDVELGVWWQDEPGSGGARVGLIASTAAFAGPFRELTFRPVDGVVGRGRSVATVESVRLTGAVRLPVEAELLGRNAAVHDRPRLLNDQPYTAGWVVRVRPVRPDEPARLLASAAQARPALEAEIRARKVRCWPITPEAELYELGVECSAVLVRLNEELARRRPGEALLLVTDDPTSPIEMVRWSDQSGEAVRAHAQDGGVHRFLVEKLEHPVPRPRSRTGAR